MEPSACLSDDGSACQRSAKPACTHNHTHDHNHNDDHKHGGPGSVRALDALPPATATRAVYLIRNMDCPMEEALIRRKLEGMPGVSSLDFNLMTRVLTVHHSLQSLESLEKALDSLDMKPEAVGHSPPASINDGPPVKWTRLILAGLVALASEAVEVASGPDGLVLALALVAIGLGGLGTYKKGWIALKNLNLNMNALMSIAVTGAVAIGQWPEAAMVMVLFTLAETIEAKSLGRAKKAIRALMELAPERATVLLDDGSWVDRDIRQVPLGTRVRVRPGERIALDGQIVHGQSAVNQAPITGESLPVEKGPGDAVFAGTINCSGSFEFTVGALAGNSTLSRIIHGVEEAQGLKAPTQRFVDRFAGIYTPIVFLVALLVAVGPPLFLGGDWLDWIYKALVLLVIACPCALVISTPVTIVSGLAAATRHGLLIKGGVFLEQGRKLNVLAVDKTGTVTYGKPEQTDYVDFGPIDSDYSLRLAASLAARSDHPVSRAIADAAHRKGVVTMDVSDFKAIPGQGVSGVMDGQFWYLGNHRLVEDLERCCPALETHIFALEEQGKTVVLLVGDHGAEGVFAVADTVKASSIEAIDDLRKMGIRTVLLTGDNEHTARVIGQQVGVDEVRGDLMPQDKLAMVEVLSSSKMVGMVGDGINDAPALAGADIGFAMGAAGTDTAIETADVALMDDDLRKIPLFIRLSKSTSAILMQNITLALGVKAVFFALTFVGITTMWMAVFADVGTSLLVVANGLRMLRK